MCLTRGKCFRVKLHLKCNIWQAKRLKSCEKDQMSDKYISNWAGCMGMIWWPIPREINKKIFYWLLPFFDPVNNFHLNRTPVIKEKYSFSVLHLVSFITINQHFCQTKSSKCTLLHQFQQQVVSNLCFILVLISQYWILVWS